LFHAGAEGRRLEEGAKIARPSASAARRVSRASSRQAEVFDGFSTPNGRRIAVVLTQTWVFFPSVRRRIRIGRLAIPTFASRPQRISFVHSIGPFRRSTCFGQHGAAAERRTAMTATTTAEHALDSPFLPLIEKPKSWLMKLAYFFSRRQFGKVLTPLKVQGARMPAAFSLFYMKVSQLDKKLTLPPELAMLIRHQVARINVCEFCIDIARAKAIEESMNEAKFDALDHYEASELFSDAERAALDYATELTRQKHVETATFDRLAQHFSQREICEIDWLVASEHLYNITNIGLGIHSDLLCDVRRGRNRAKCRPKAETVIHDV
jgi:alkylhydroperoxidase family enzyme